MQIRQISFRILQLSFNCFPDISGVYLSTLSHPFIPQTDVVLVILSVVGCERLWCVLQSVILIPRGKLICLHEGQRCFAKNLNKLRTLCFTANISLMLTIGCVTDVFSVFACHCAECRKKHKLSLIVVGCISGQVYSTL